MEYAWTQGDIINNIKNLYSFLNLYQIKSKAGFWKEYQQFDSILLIVVMITMKNFQKELGKILFKEISITNLTRMNKNLTDQRLKLQTNVVPSIFLLCELLSISQHFCRVKFCR